MFGGKRERTKQAQSNARSNLLSLFGGNGTSGAQSNDKLIYKYVVHSLDVDGGKTRDSNHRTREKEPIPESERKRQEEEERRKKEEAEKKAAATEAAKAGESGKQMNYAFKGTVKYVYKLNSNGQFAPLRTPSPLGCVLMGSGISYTFVVYDGQNNKYMIVPIVRSVKITINPSAPSYVYFAMDDANQWSVACNSESDAMSLLRTSILIQAHSFVHNDANATSNEAFSIPIRSGNASDVLRPGYKAGFTYRAWEFTAGASDLPHTIVDETVLKDSGGRREKLVVGLKDQSPVAGLETAFENLCKNGHYMILIPPAMHVGGSLTTISSRAWILVEAEITKLKSGTLPPPQQTTSKDSSVSSSSTTTTTTTTSSSSSTDAPSFIPATTWQGTKDGYEFKMGEKGVGYYKSLAIAQVTTAPTSSEAPQTTVPRSRSNSGKPRFGISVLPITRKKEDDETNTTPSSDSPSTATVTSAKTTSSSLEDNKSPTTTSASSSTRLVPTENTMNAKSTNDQTMAQLVPTRQPHAEQTHHRSSMQYSAYAPIASQSFQHLHLMCQSIDRQLSLVARDVTNLVSASNDSSSSLRNVSHDRHIKDRSTYGKEQFDGPALLDGLSDVIEQNAKLRESVAEKESTIVSLQKKEKELQSELYMKMNEGQKMLRESLEASKKLLEMQQQFNPLQKEVERLRVENLSLHEDSAGTSSTTNAAITALEDKLKTAEEELEDTKSRFAASTVDVERLKSELSNARDELAKETIKYKTSSEQCDALRKELESANAESATTIEKLRQELSTSSATEEKAVSSVDEIESAVKEAMNEVYQHLKGPFAKIQKGDDAFKLRAVAGLPKLIAKILRKVSTKKRRSKVTKSRTTANADEDLPSPHPPPPRSRSASPEKTKATEDNAPE